MTRQDRFRRVAQERLGAVRIAVEAVYHRHNTSAILRTCDALGVHRAHLVAGRFVPGRGAARGAERWIDLHTHPTAADAVDRIRADGCALWVADLGEGACTPSEVPLALDRPICLWVGAEVLGVSDEARAAADGVVTVPMRGFSQSLNVSVATALILGTLTDRARALGRGALLSEAERDRLIADWVCRDEAATGLLRARAT